MKKQIMLTVVTILILAACKKEEPIFSTSDFPVKVGNTWTYQRIDSLSGITDTFVATISGVTTFQSKPAYLWVQTSGTISDTLYLTIANDTINIRDLYFNQYYSFVFPIRNGSYWNTLAYFICTAAGSQSVNGVNYPNFFIISAPAQGGGYSGNRYIGIAKGIGIVSDMNNIRSNVGGSKNYKYTLINYHLN